jgi:Spirocyclase AveC-like
MTTTTEPSAAALVPRTVIETQRRSPQVKLWASLGAVSLTFGAITWLRWLSSGKIKATDPGPDHYSTTNLVVMRIIEAGFLVIAVYFIVRWVIRPLIREHTIHLDGMIILAGFTTWVWDPLSVNIFQTTLTYNAHAINLGSWVNYLPFWSTPNSGNFPEPLAIAGLGYIWWLWGSILIGCEILRRFKARYPKMSDLTMFTILGLLFLPIDFFFEMLILVKTQLWAYPSTIGRFTFFAGKTYQFPAYQMVLSAFFTMGIVMVRWYKDDRGRSVVERGVDELRIPQRAKKGVSFLAITGFLHFVFFITYVVGFNWMGLFADSSPAMPSYLQSGGVCGKGTEYACPGNKLVPIPKIGSLHIAPDDPRLRTGARTPR